MSGDFFFFLYKFVKKKKINSFELPYSGVFDSFFRLASALCHIRK